MNFIIYHKLHSHSSHMNNSYDFKRTIIKFGHKD